MVRAILEKRKTQTRRIIKPTAQDAWLFNGSWSDEYIKNPGNCLVDHCPYGVPGNVLWVRETWLQTPSGSILFKADDPACSGWNDHGKTIKWRSSRFMPRWASRITLEITDVRVQRVQEISEEDAIAEGCKGYPCDCNRIMCTDCMNTGWIESPILDYMLLWDKLNYKRGYGWVVNPWVWCLSFRVLEIQS